METKQERLAGIVAENQRRSSEALRIFRPMLTQLPFFTSKASERIVRGGNRSGKSMSAFAELASAATQTPITAADGTQVPYKYPKRPLLIWVIGYDQAHIGGTIHRMLFRPGAFKTICDRQTGLLRAFDPEDADDIVREKNGECQQSQPLIPERMIDPSGWAWENKGERVFTVCRLTNGTEIHAFSSKAEPKQGDPVDVIHIDEDVASPRHIGEWQARLSDTAGRLWWSAFPHSKNEALIDLSERANEQRNWAKPDVEEIQLTFSGNPFIDADEKRKRLQGWSEDEQKARDLGEFSTDNVLVYPDFSKAVHASPPEELGNDDAIDAILRSRGAPPSNWTRYLALDPGHSRSAVLFLAVPPPEFGDAVIVYNELYLRNHDAESLAVKVRDKVAGQPIQTFIIDNRAGRQTPMGFNHTVYEQYQMAFRKFGIHSVSGGCRFEPGSDNVDGRLGLVRAWLKPRHAGQGRMRAILRIMADRCPNTCREFLLYKKRVVSDAVKEEPISKNDHLMDNLGYLAAHDPQYISPVMGGGEATAAYRYFQTRRSKRNAGRDKSVHMGPTATV
jgi:hypothetical protein